MPELPEMETYRSALADKITNRLITDAEITREKCLNMPVAAFREEVSGRKAVNVERRAKQLLIHLDSGKVLLIHLMLGGWMYFGQGPSDTPDHKAQVILHFGDVDRLYLLGLRFGYIHLLTRGEALEQLAELGPEPLSGQFDEASFKDILKKKRGSLKNTLVDQHFVAGIGTRYADEICFDARLLPLTNCSELEPNDADALYHAIPSTLGAAVAEGGYMSREFFEGDTFTGGYSDQLEVYGREGEPCERCGHLIERVEVSSRKVFYCPNCQH